MKLVLKYTLLLLIALTNHSVCAQDWKPKGTIGLLVGSPPGGAIDTVARITSQIFSSMGWSSIVSNKPGADQALAANYVARSQPNGLTILVAGSVPMAENIVNPGPAVEYKITDFEPVIAVSANSFLLLTHPSLQVNSYSEFQSWTRKNPNLYNLGVWAKFPHTIMKEISRLERMPTPQEIPFKGSAPSMTQLRGGHIPFAVDNYVGARALLETNKVVALAVFDNQKANIFPGLPVISHKYPQFETFHWSGLYVPAGTPANIVSTLNKIVNEGLNDPKVRYTIESVGFRVIGGTPANLKKINEQTIVFIENMLSLERK